jgi:enoyl-CoA hydratase
VARKLARGPQQAVRFTKRSLNNWLRVAGPAFDASLALEMMGFFSADLSEGVAALQEKRQPSFPGFPARIRFNQGSSRRYSPRM